MQTSIPASIAGLEPGMRADAATPTLIVPGYNAEASAEIAFGLAVALDTGTADDAIKLLANSTDLVWGLVAHEHGFAPATSAAPELGTTGIKPTGRMPVARKGAFVVTVEEAVAPGDRAWVRFVTNGGTHPTPGAWRKSQEVIGGPANTCIDITKQAVYRSSASAGGKAVVEIDFTNAP